MLKKHNCLKVKKIKTRNKEKKTRKRKKKID